LFSGGDAVALDPKTLLAVVYNPLKSLPKPHSFLPKMLNPVIDLYLIEDYYA